MKHHHLVCLFFAGLVALLTASCATEMTSAKKAPPGSGLTEYKQLVRDAHRAMVAAMNALTRVAGQKAPCPPSALANYSAQIDHLAAESVTLRARSQAMQSRGNEYFHNWEKRMAEVPDADFRARAEQHRPELEQRFEQIKQHSVEGRQAFVSLLTELRKIRSTLEKDPGAVESPTTKQLVDRAGHDGLAVEQQLDAIEENLDAMIALVLPAGAQAHR